MVGTTETHAAVAARIEKPADLPVVAADQDHGLAGELARDVVPGIRQLGLVREEQPRAAKQPVLLHLVDLGVDVDAARHFVSLRAHEIREARAVTQQVRIDARCVGGH